MEALAALCVTAGNLHECSEILDKKGQNDYLEISRTYGPTGFLVKKALKIWLMVMIYALSACSGISAAGYCMDQPAPAEAEHSDHQHYHFQAYVSVHAFLHVLSAADYSVIVSHHCCCLASSPGDDVQVLHIVRNHRPGAETFAAHHLTAFVDSPAFRPEFQERSFCSANGPRDHNPTVASIRSVSLLI